MNFTKSYTLDRYSSLILEGGGLRGVFTCGVLDNFMERGIKFPFTVGVSAGACNGLSYMSGQMKRAKYSNIDLLEKYNYVGFKYLFTQRNIMDFKLLFDKFPTEIIPYDYPAYEKSEGRYVMVTTNCLTGEANYFEEKHSQKRKLLHRRRQKVRSRQMKQEMLLIMKILQEELDITEQEMVLLRRAADCFRCGARDYW